MLVAELNIWYIDDGTSGGEPVIVLHDQIMIKECKKLGLEVNPTKCDPSFYGEKDKRIVEQFDAISPDIRIL